MGGFLCEKKEIRGWIEIDIYMENDGKIGLTNREKYCILDMYILEVRGWLSGGASPSQQDTMILQTIDF